MSEIWIVNDRLTCIPGTKTFWHDLLEWIPNAVDKTGGHTDFTQLANKIEDNLVHVSPACIIRNATFFRKITGATRTISFLQDIYSGSLREQQIDVINNSDIIVFNSQYTKSKYASDINNDRPVHVIPIGTDFEKFKPMDRHACMKELHIAEGSILFVGAPSVTPKGFDLMQALIRSCPRTNFVLVMKEAYVSLSPNVKVFNKVSQEMLAKIYNACAALICTSKEETLHLASVEAAACGIPVMTTNIGINYDSNFVGGVKLQAWGATFEPTVTAAKEAIEAVTVSKFDTRNAVSHLSRPFCQEAWIELLASN